MTDNRTAELLREGLTERGIEWRSGLDGVTFVGDWCFVEYENGKLAATCEPVLTPDQAIAATLGSESIDYMLNTIGKLEEENERLRSSCGTLTADQVREAIEEAKAELLESCEYVGDMYQRQSDVLKAFGKMEQAIADELNAERHVETCTVTHDFNCSNCGKQIGVVRNCEMYETCDGRQAWKSLDHEVCDVPNYCPNCGAKVIQGVDNAN